MSKNSKQSDPLQNLFSDINKIIDFIEIKDASKAAQFETPEIKSKSSMWMNAKMERDSYTTYHHFWNLSMFQEVVSNIKINDYKYYMANPFNVPVVFRDNLLRRGREAFFEWYEEENEYYRMLNGLPPIGTKSSDFIYLSEPLKNQLHATDEPVHKLSPLIQNNYINTDEYKQVLAANPNKEYLKYLGIYKIDIFTARVAKDFDIIRYTLNRSDINPNLIDKFASTYADYREYVMVALYNRNFENIYVGYRSFMGSIIMMMTLTQLANKSVEAINNRNFLDDSILYIILSMYDIPDDLLLSNEVRRKLATNILKITKEKATDDVYYDLVNILGYQDVVISKLLLMKGQQFDSSNGYSTTPGNVNPYFLQLDLKDENPYETIASGQAPIHDYHSIIDNDPRWWDTEDTREILKNRPYSMADSKYIMVEAVIHQMKYMFESIYFTRLVLDNKAATDTFTTEIPEIFGTEPVSIYDLMVFIISAMCMNNGLNGDIISEESRLLATAGFNFDMDFDSFEEYLDTTRYVDIDRVHNYINNLRVMDPTDINRLFNEVLYPMREWLELKINSTTNRHEFIEYENIYRALYTYDINRNTFLEDYKPPLEIIKDTYELTDEDLRVYQHFYPRTFEGDRVAFNELENYHYRNPFIGLGNEIDFYIHIIIETPYGDEDRGYLYFHDILNSEDLRELTNPNGTRIFMDYEDDEVGWELNQKAVNKALELLEKLDPQALYNAKFQKDTPIANSGGLKYSVNERLPASIRSGIYKNILIDKVRMDLDGYAKPPKTYKEYLYRKNSKLYDLLTGGNRFELNKEAWLEDVLRVVLAIETELDLHMKYFEQSIVGSDLFFKPLITLIQHFKSKFVDFAKTGLKFIFDDKMDAGGNANTFKLFDEVDFIVHFVTLANRGYESQFGLYDAEHSMIYHINLNDRSEEHQMTIGNGFAAQVRTERMGSIRMVDEMKCFKNGKLIDPNGFDSVWMSGEPGSGRWSQEDDILIRARKETVRVQTAPIDFDAWKETR